MIRGIIVGQKIDEEFYSNLDGSWDGRLVGCRVG